MARFGGNCSDQFQQLFNEQPRGELQNQHCGQQEHQECHLCVKSVNQNHFRGDCGGGFQDSSCDQVHSCSGGPHHHQTWPGHARHDQYQCALDGDPLICEDCSEGNCKHCRKINKRIRKAQRKGKSCRYNSNCCHNQRKRKNSDSGSSGSSDSGSSDSSDSD